MSGHDIVPAFMLGILRGEHDLRTFNDCRVSLLRPDKTVIPGTDRPLGKLQYNIIDESLVIDWKPADYTWVAPEPCIGVVITHGDIPIATRKVTMISEGEKITYLYRPTGSRITEPELTLWERFLIYIGRKFS